MNPVQEDLNQELFQSLHAIESNPFSEENYDEYLQVQRRSTHEDHIEKLLAMRMIKLEHFALGTSDLTNWLEDLVDLEDSLKPGLYVEFYTLLVEEYPVSLFWLVYLEYLIGMEDRENPGEMVRQMFSLALNDVANDYKDSAKVWSIVLQYFTDEYETQQSESLFCTLIALHLKRISYPNLKLDEFFNEFSSFISKHDPDNYEAQLTKANRVYASTKKKSKYIESHEIHILQDPDNLLNWVAYLESVHKYMNDDVSLLTTLFNRFLQQFNLSDTRREDSIQVWLKYIYLLYDSSHISIPGILENTLLKFVRSFPTSPIAYSEFIRNCSLFEDSSGSFDYIITRLEKVDRKWEDFYDKWKIIPLSILTHRYHMVQRLSIADEVGNLYDDIEKYVTLALDNNDAFHSVEKLALSIHTQLGNHDRAKKLVERLTTRFPLQSDVWLYAFQFYKFGEVDVDNLRELYKEALRYQNMDWPQKVIEDWFHFEQIHGDLQSYRDAVVVANKVMEEILVAAPYEESGDDLKEYDPKNKSLTEEKSQIEEPKRSRETLVVEVSNLAPDTTELSLESFFKNCGTIRTINLLDSSRATIEFSNEQEVFSALTRDGKAVNGSNIKVARKLESTIFIANYPPSMQQEELKTLFSISGEIVSMRFPSQNSRRERRFCYIEYPTSTDAKRAVTRFHQIEQEDKLSKKKYRLLVSISDPSRARDPPNERTVRLNNLAFSVGQEAISRYLEKYGLIERVAIPLKGKKSLEHLNDGFAFVTFKHKADAEQSLKLDGDQFHGRIIEVSKQRNTHNDDFSKFNDSKTIGVTNVDETLTSEQIKVYFAQEIGPISKITKVPQLFVALIEFERASDSGKAVLQAEKLMLGNKKIEIKAKADVLRIISGGDNKIVKKRNLMVPLSVQRKRRR